MPKYEGCCSERKKLLLRAFKAVKKIKDDDVPAKVEEGLFLGSCGAARNKAALKSLNVTHILTVAHKLVPLFPTEFEYKIIKVADTEETRLEPHFPGCFDFIDEAIAKGGAVLVHCAVGKSRSVTVVLAYLMKKRHLGLVQAFEQVKRVRPLAHPNMGFLLGLWTYGDSLGVSDEGVAEFISSFLPRRSRTPDDKKLLEKTYHNKQLREKTPDDKQLPEATDGMQLAEKASDDEQLAEKASDDEQLPANDMQLAEKAPDDESNYKQLTEMTSDHRQLSEKTTDIDS